MSHVLGKIKRIHIFTLISYRIIIEGYNMSYRFCKYSLFLHKVIKITCQKTIHIYIYIKLLI